MIQCWYCEEKLDACLLLGFEWWKRKYCRNWEGRDRFFSHFTTNTFVSGSSQISFISSFAIHNNFLLTKLGGRTEEYWPEVVAARTELSEVPTRMTEGQYSPAWLEQARLVSNLSYGTSTNQFKNQSESSDSPQDYLANHMISVFFTITVFNT